MNEGLIGDLSQVVAELNIRRHYGNMSKHDDDCFKWYMRVISEAMTFVKDNSLEPTKNLEES